MGKDYPPRRRACSLAAVLVASASAFALQTNAPAAAQTAEALAARDYDIPAQPLSSALTEFARQSDVRVLYAYNDLAGRAAPSIRGAYRPDEALRLLLDGSGLRARVDDSGAIRLENPDRPQALQAGDGALSGANNAAAAPENETIVVTGTRIRGGRPVGSDIVVLDRQRIEDSGYGSTQQVLQSLPQNFGGSQNEANTLNGVSNSNFSFGSSVDLRGLGADATLTLVNGRRIAPSGFGNFADISTIPLLAVERAEVLADGASSVYGSDAVAGVVNIILREPGEALETSLRYGAADGGAEEKSFGQLIGASWRGGGVLAAFEHRERDRLAAGDRDFAASNDLSPLGGADYRNAFANPGNIIQIGATPVQYAIPAGQDGLTLTQAQLLPGVVNRQNARADTDLVPEQETDTLYLSAAQSLSPAIRVRAEALWGQRDYVALDDDPRTLTLSVPQTNAYRQANGLFAGQGALRIRYSFLDDLGPIVREGRTQSAFAALGAEVDLFADWRMDAYASYSDELDRGVFRGQVNTVALNQALASASLDTAFNPFGDGSHTNASVLATLTQQDITRQHSKVTTVSAKFDGSLFELPAGSVRAAFGAEWREENFSLLQVRTTALGASSSLSDVVGSREVSAAFAEVLVPLLGPGDGASPILEASFSVRAEDYSDFGTTTNPKFGLRWSPVDSLDMRASYGTSFKAPLLYQLGTPSQGLFSEDPASFDPEATGTGTWLLFLGGGSPDLGPETAENWTLGFDLNPTALPDLRLSVTYFSVLFEDRIATPPNYIDAYTQPEQFAGIFFRNPSQALVDSYLAQLTGFFGALPGPGEVEAIFDNRLRNIARMDVSGVDAHGGYTWRTDIGDIDLDASLSWLEKFDIDAGGTVPVVDHLNGVGNPPDFRSRLTGTWSSGNWRAAAAWNYIDGYENSASAANPEIDAWSTIDLRLAHAFAGASSGDEPGTEIALSISNLFDTDPPFVDHPSAIGFDSANASPIGRFVAVSLRQRW